MDIFIPIGIGFALNIAVYIIVFFIVKNKRLARATPFISTFILILISFIIGRWIGMGLAVISLGMLVAAVVTLVASFFHGKEINNISKN
ncbi:hypothetical protein MXL46_11665 [Heyndrickxia sporothermodurans]|uniref:hypothetical protein n=1 Tax=Heyndrickxia sporothermodurans TaxID=46224 RepID=UPI002DBC8F91|nr:hypothetical protein [Heyndrickxia sporothermodurans]MEB6549743.1 hypothetical protein [Heyndrickxia sporothermodurans]